MTEAQQHTVEKYLAFLHYLRLNLNTDAPDFKVTVAMTDWKVNTNLPKALIELSAIMRIGFGKYTWVGPLPDMEMAARAVAVINRLAKENRRANHPKPQPAPLALLTGPTSSTPLGADVNDLKQRVTYLESLILDLMEQVA